MNESLRGMLAEAVKGEGDDNLGYDQMAKMADDCGLYHAAGVLRDIAEEECTHKHLIKMILEGCIA